MLAPEAGFRRLENLLYRIEVHDDATVSGKPRYKWSRDNGSIEAQVVRFLGHPAADELEVASIGRDGRLSIAVGCWIEFVDDTHELQGKPGALVQVLKTEGNVVTIDLTTKIGSLDETLYPKNPRVRRWDGHGEIAPALPNSNSGWTAVEDGIEIKFTPGGYRIGDYWLIPARTATTEVEWPLEANKPSFQAPHGVLRAFARLALLHLQGGIFTALSDCRTLFPTLSDLTNLFYIGGDGQEVAPSPLAPANIPLPSPLRVAVFNGQFPVAGAQVRFDASHGALPNTTLSQTVATGADGVASIVWSVSPTVLDQTCTASLLEGGVVSASKFATLRFSARLSRSSEVSYDPSKCADLKSLGVQTVQAAIDALCQKSHGGCCRTVGKGGDFETLGAALQTLINEPALDICLCLLVGDHVLGEGGSFDFEQGTHLYIHGAGPASRLILRNQELNFVGCASLSLRDFDIVAFGPECRLYVSTCEELVIARVNVRGQSRLQQSLVQVDRVSLVHISGCVIHAFSANVTDRFKEFAERAELLKLLAPSIEETQRYAPIGRDVIARFVQITDAEQNSFTQQQLVQLLRYASPTSEEKAALEALSAVLIPPRSSSRIKAVLERLRLALTGATPALALAFLDADGDVTLVDNRIRGQLTLYGETLLEPQSATELADRIGERELRVESSGGYLRLRGNHIRGIRFGELILKQIFELGDGNTLQGCYRALLADSNTLETGEIQLAAVDLSLLSNVLTSDDDAITIAGQGKYVANCVDGKPELFPYGHGPEILGNGGLIFRL